MDGNQVASDHAEARPDMRWKSMGGTVTDDEDGLSRKLESMWFRQTPNTDSFLGLAKPTREGAAAPELSQGPILHADIENWGGGMTKDEDVALGGGPQGLIDGIVVPNASVEPFAAPAANNFNRRWGIFDWFWALTEGMAGEADTVARGPYGPPHASSALAANNFNRRWGIFNWVSAVINGMVGVASDNEARDVEPNAGGAASGGPSSPAADNFNRRWSIFNWFGPVPNGMAGASNAGVRVPLLLLKLLLILLLLLTI